MKIDIQKVIVQVPLSEYAKDYKEAGNPFVHVWVNIPRAMLVKRDELDTEYMRLMTEVDMAKKEFRERFNATKSKNERERLLRNNQKWEGEQQAKIEDYTTRNYAWFVELWSQGPEDTHWTVDELRALAETDHLLLGWLADRTRELLSTRRIDQKN